MNYETASFLRAKAKLATISTTFLSATRLRGAQASARQYTHKNPKSGFGLLLRRTWRVGPFDDVTNWYIEKYKMGFYDEQ